MMIGRLSRFYTHLIEGAGADSSRAAYALHDAVPHLRDVVGDEKDLLVGCHSSISVSAPLRLPPPECCYAIQQA